VQKTPASGSIVTIVILTLFIVGVAVTCECLLS
jgi:hypothetical protein